MGEESEKRFEAIMNKLFHSPPKSKPTNNSSSRDVLQISRGLKRPRSSSMGMKFSGNVVEEPGSSLWGSATSAEGPLCRPWDRDDLFRRLSTFKSMTWFAKPQVVSPLACARRGWVNVDTDTIGCPSCGARLLFSTPSTWTRQQVEKAAMVFSLKLESGHKLLCHWMNNSCSEELAQFPMVSRAGLIEDFKKRVFSLSQLTALPVVSLAHVDNMKSPELKQFLREFPTSEYHVPVENSSKEFLGNGPEPVSSVSYYQALKLISLCGWEPHVLPYTVDIKVGEKKSIKDASATVTKQQKQKIDVYSLCFNEGTKSSGQLQFDPSSVVLDCKLCGASVGLWAFSTISRPMEYLRFVGLTEINGRNNISQNEVGALESSSGEDIHTGSSEGVKTTVAPSSASLGFTIAGGPPPAMLKYSATITLPVVSESLSIQSLIQSKLKDHLSQVEEAQVKSTNVITDGTSLTTESDFIAPNPLEFPQTVSECSILNEQLNDGEITVSSAVADHHRFEIEDNVPSRNGASEPNAQKMIEAGKYEQGSSSQSNSQDDIGKGSPLKHKLVEFRPREDKNLQSTLKSTEFDPFQQHRHFCPWIMSVGKTAAGWKETLSALQEHKEFSLSSSSLIEVDDPVASVEKLLTEKRTKFSGGS